MLKESGSGKRTLQLIVKGVSLPQHHSQQTGMSQCQNHLLSKMIVHEMRNHYHGGVFSLIIVCGRCKDS